MRISLVHFIAIGTALACSVCAQDTETETKAEAKSKTSLERKLDPAAAAAERFVRCLVEQHDVDSAMQCVSSPFFRIDGSIQANLKLFDSNQKTRQHLLSVIAKDAAISHKPECRLQGEFTEDLRSVFKHEHVKVLTRDMKSRWEKAGLFGPNDRAFGVKSEFFSVMVIVAEVKGTWQVTAYAFHYAR